MEARAGEEGEPKAFLYCPEFYGYEQAIADALQRKGFSVERYFPNEYKEMALSLPQKFFMRLARYSALNWVKERANALVFPRQNQALRGTAGGAYELLVVVKGYGLTCHSIRAFPARRKILYQWDRIAKFPSITPIYSAFDGVFTFSKEDAARGYGAFLENFPMPRTPSGIAPQKRAFFIGEYSTYRKGLLEQLAGKCRTLGLETDFCLIDFSPSPAQGSEAVPVIAEPLDRDGYGQRGDACLVHFDLCRFGENTPTQRFQDALKAGRLLVTDHDAGPVGVEAFLGWDRAALERHLASPPAAKQSLAVADVDTWLGVLLS